MNRGVEKAVSDRTRTQQLLIIASAAVELVVTAIALVDLALRTADQMRGTKPPWAPGCIVQPPGPVGRPSHAGLGQTLSSE